ncbi:Cochaperone protein [Mycoemilia scoparia]|uniref:Cochaperone protein n=1 Tax=Mycoemilia scoparia TaxID=417184 RepID=A0A9W8A5M1_9FUNG|nr:Cochaperone protein [Mycoemilia scoparia]
MSKQQAKKYFEEANNSFFDGDYDASLDFIGKAIKEDPNSPDYLFRRAQIHQQLKNFESAAGDAKQVIDLTKGKPEFLKVYYKALHLYGKHLFETEKYLEATLVFLEAKSINSEDSVNNEYIEKTKEHVSEEELSAAQEKAKRDDINEALKRKEKDIKHQWYQNDTHVTVDIFARKAKKDNVTLNLAEESVEFKWKTSDGTEVSKTFTPLFSEIVPKESSYEVLSTKVELKLKKKIAGIKWSELFKTEKKSSGPPVASYPTSSHKHHNWDKIAKDTETDPELKAEGEQALNELFQKIYRDADDDTRRAMIKSYQESNGTTLSTNWAEVSKGVVETKPPESMVAKKYEI